jgi:hypothetical protein
MRKLNFLDLHFALSMIKLKLPSIFSSNVMFRVVWLMLGEVLETNCCPHYLPLKFFLGFMLSFHLVVSFIQSVDLLFAGACGI